MTLTTNPRDATQITHSGRTLLEIWSQARAELPLGGLRTIQLAERWENGSPIGREITASIHHDGDQIIDALGRDITDRVLR